MSDRPEALTFKPSAVPDKLRERDNWVAWRYEWKSGREEWTKIPIDATTGDFAKSTEPRTWSSFERALDYHDDPATDTDGVGFVVSDSGAVCGIDLDDCRDPVTGDIDPWARDLLEAVPTYAEVSPSGTGLRAFGLGFVPDGGNRGDIDGAEGHLEIYDTGRYLTVTGHAVEESPATVEQVHEEIDSIHGEHIRDDAETAKTDADGGVQADSPGSNPGGNTTGSGSLTDETLVERAKNAKNGDDFERLWNGSTAGHPSHSEARLALLNHLAFWTGGDDGRMLELFKKSDLYRGDDDDRTLENYDIPKARQGTSEFYDPDGDGRDRLPHPVGATDAPGDPDLRPESVKAEAGLGDDGSISDLTDREKAACAWNLIRRSEDVHVRVRREDGQLWAYDNGVWKPEGERALTHAARRAVGSMNFGTNVVNQLEAQVKGDPHAEVELDTLGLPPGLLAVENGLIDLKRAADGSGYGRRDLEPEDYALKQLPVEYDPDAEYEEWNALVEEWSEEGRADALQEYVGYCLHRGDMPIHRALMLVGSGANGKSTFLHVVRELLGSSNTSSFELQTLADDENYRDRFFGSVANIDEDLSARQLKSSLGMLKKLFAGDPIEAARKYHDPYDYEPTGKHLYAANEVPDIDVSDDDEAFWRRWLLVEFPNHYPAGERDPDLRDRLTTDEALSGVLNWAIEGWNRLLEQGHFTNEEHEAYAKRQRWQSWGETVDEFLSDCVERDENADRITTSEAFERFKAWCRENGRDPDTKQRSFTGKLKNEDVGYKKSVKIDKANKRGYTALGFSDDVPSVEVGEEEESDDASTSLDSFEESTDATDGDGDETLTQRVSDFLEEHDYGPEAEVTVPNVAGAPAIDARPDRVESAFEELAGDGGPLKQKPDGWLYQGVSD